jgi:hypothetical protein
VTPPFINLQPLLTDLHQACLSLYITIIAWFLGICNTVESSRCLSIPTLVVNTKVCVPILHVLAINYCHALQITVIGLSGQATSGTWICPYLLRTRRLSHSTRLSVLLKTQRVLQIRATCALLETTPLWASLLKWSAVQDCLASVKRALASVTAESELSIFGMSWRHPRSAC